MVHVLYVLALIKYVGAGIYLSLRYMMLHVFNLQARAGLFQSSSKAFKLLYTHACVISSSGT